MAPSCRPRDPALASGPDRRFRMAALWPLSIRVRLPSHVAVNANGILLLPGERITPVPPATLPPPPPPAAAAPGRRARRTSPGSVRSSRPAPRAPITAANSAARRPSSRCAATSSSSRIGGRPEPLPPPPARSPAPRLTSSAFCSPVDASRAGIAFAHSSPRGRPGAARPGCAPPPGRAATLAERRPEAGLVARPLAYERQIGPREVAGAAGASRAAPSPLPVRRSRARAPPSGPRSASNQRSCTASRISRFRSRKLGRSRPRPGRGPGRGSASPGRGTAGARPALEPQPVHRRRQPQHPRHAAERGLARRLPSISTRRAGTRTRSRRCAAPSGDQLRGTFQPAASGTRASSSLAAPRSPRPGESSDTASTRLVLPAPFGPNTATGRASSSSRVRPCERNRPSPSGRDRERGFGRGGYGGTPWGHRTAAVGG